MRMSIVAVLGLVISAPSIAQTHVCQPAVDAQLQKYGISPNSVASTEVEPKLSGDDDRRVYGYKYWMRMKSCEKGYLLITMWDNCQVIGTPSTSGPCEIAGVPKD